MSAGRSAFLAILLLAGSAALTWAGDVPGAKSAEAPKLDAFGDPLPTGAYARFGTIRLRQDAQAVAFPIGHARPVTQIRISPNGRYVCSADSESSDVVMWDVSSGRAVRRFKGFQYSQRIDLSPDGKLVAAAFGNSARIWETATGREVFNKPESDQIICLGMHFLGDSQRLAMSFCTRNITIFDCKTREFVNEFQTPGEFPARERFALSSDGRLLAITSRFTPVENPDAAISGIIVWDVVSRRALHHIDFYDGNSFSSALSRDCRTLATWGNDGMIRLWELSTGQQRMAIKDGPNPREESWLSQSFAFSADGATFASIGSDRMSVDLWDLASGTKLGALKGHQKPINMVQFTPDGRRLLTCSDDTTILGWDMTRPEWQPRTLSSKLGDTELARHWERLRNVKVDEAHRSKWALAGDPAKTIPFLRERFQAPRSLRVETIRAWIADLDAAQYSVRERASRQLLDHVDQAGLELRAVLKSTTSAEVRRRINQILASVENGVPDPDHLRELRAVEVLEQIANAEARELLRSLARSANSARTGLDAAESLKRLEQRPP